MSDADDPRGSRAADTHPRLRLAALVAVIVGVVLLASAAFLLSYSGIHQIALQAGVAPRLARLYPMIFDAMLVIAGAAALALRGAGWWSRAYVWLSLLVLLGAVAAGDAVHAMGVALPRQPSRAAVAVVPWALLLLGFGFWLAMLRQLRRLRMAANAAAKPGQGRATASAAGVLGAGTAVTWAGRGSAPARPGTPRTGIDALLEPRTARTAEVAEPSGGGFADEQADTGDTSGQSPYIVHEVYPGVLTEQALAGPGFVSALPSPSAQAYRAADGEMRHGDAHAERRHSAEPWHTEPPGESAGYAEPAGYADPAGDGAEFPPPSPHPPSHADGTPAGAGAPQGPALSRFDGSGLAPSAPGGSGNGESAQPQAAAPGAAGGDAGAESPDQSAGAHAVGERDQSGAHAEAAAGPAAAEVGQPTVEASEGASVEASDGAAGSEGMSATFDRMRSSPTPPHPTPSQD